MGFNVSKGKMPSLKETQAELHHSNPADTEKETRSKSKNARGHLLSENGGSNQA
jgi:hypothetical protein